MAQFNSKPMIYNFGREGCNACWSALKESMNQLTKQQIQLPMQVFYHSPQNGLPPRHIIQREFKESSASGYSTDVAPASKTNLAIVTSVGEVNSTAEDHLPTTIKRRRYAKRVANKTLPYRRCSKTEISAKKNLCSLMDFWADDLGPVGSDSNDNNNNNKNDLDDPKKIDPIAVKISQSPSTPTDIKPVTPSTVMKPMSPTTDVDPIAETTIVESTTLTIIEPIAQTTIFEPVTPTTAVEPITPATTIEPIAQAIIIEPISSSAAVEPVAQVTVIEPIAQTTVVEPIIEPISVIEPNSPTTIAKPAAPATVVEPVTPPSMTADPIAAIEPIAPVSFVETTVVDDGADPILWSQLSTMIPSSHSVTSGHDNDKAIGHYQNRSVEILTESDKCHVDIIDKSSFKYEEKIKEIDNTIISYSRSFLGIALFVVLFRLLF